MVLYIPVNLMFYVLPSGDQCLAAFLQCFSLTADIDVEYLDQLYRIINRHKQQDTLDQAGSYLQLHFIDDMIHGIMDKLHDSYRIKSPGDGTLEANDPPIIEGLIIIIPP